MGHSKVWTHYIYINIDKEIKEKEIAESFWLKPEKCRISKKRIRYDYFDKPISDLEFHGGCTFYSKESGVDGADRVVKIGCDYQHLWDKDQDYDLAYVTKEVRNTIDSLHRIATILKWCSWCGQYLEEKDHLDKGCIKCKGDI